MNKNRILLLSALLFLTCDNKEALAHSCSNAEFYCAWSAPNGFVFIDKYNRYKYSTGCKWHGFSLCEPMHTPEELVSKYCSDAIIDPGENEWHYGPQPANAMQWTGEGCFL